MSIDQEVEVPSGQRIELPTVLGEPETIAPSELGEVVRISKKHYIVKFGDHIFPFPRGGAARRLGVDVGTKVQVFFANPELYTPTNPTPTHCYIKNGKPELINSIYEMH